MKLYPLKMKSEKAKEEINSKEENTESVFLSFEHCSNITLQTLWMFLVY